MNRFFRAMNMAFSNFMASLNPIDFYENDFMAHKKILFYGHKKLVMIQN